MSTINAIDSNIPIQIALGGTNTTSFATTDGVVYYDGTKLTVTAAGTAGQVLTSNGTGVAPTYQAVPSGLVLLLTQSVSNVANVVFNSTYITSTYNVYFVTFTQVQPATNNDVMNMDWSTNNGSGYLSSGYLSGFNSHAYNSATWANTSSTTTSPVTGQIPNTSYASGFIFLYNMDTTIPARGLGQAIWASATIADIFQFNTGTTAINNIMFSCAAGNISGIFSLYGIAN